MEVRILLHNVRSSHNVGSIFRTADAAGVSKIYLTGYTPTPMDRFKRPNKEIAKTGLGAERFISWEYAKTPFPILKRLRSEDVRVIGVEQDARATDYRKQLPQKPVVFIFGNEVRGLSKQMRDACDQLVEIPMRGKKESLNVAVTAGIVLFNCID